MGRKADVFLKDTTVQFLPKAKLTSEAVRN